MDGWMKTVDGWMKIWMGRGIIILAPSPEQENEVIFSTGVQVSAPGVITFI